MVLGDDLGPLAAHTPWRPESIYGGIHLMALIIGRSAEAEIEAIALSERKLGFFDILSCGLCFCQRSG